MSLVSDYLDFKKRLRFMLDEDTTVVDVDSEGHLYLWESCSLTKEQALALASWIQEIYT
jgi:hypothetical protein